MLREHKLWYNRNCNLCFNKSGYNIFATLPSPTCTEIELFSYTHINILRRSLCFLAQKALAAPLTLLLGGILLSFVIIKTQKLSHIAVFAVADEPLISRAKTAHSCIFLKENILAQTHWAPFLCLPSLSSMLQHQRPNTFYSLQYFSNNTRQAVHKPCTKSPPTLSNPKESPRLCGTARTTSANVKKLYTGVDIRK